MAMKEVSVVIICLLLISVVRGEDLTCKPGEGIVPMFTSGLASQCSGLSKITTEAECKLAAEYNSKNNIDKNVGCPKIMCNCHCMAGTVRSSFYPKITSDSFCIQDRFNIIFWPISYGSINLC